jgi:hypothetical protein
VHVNRNVVLVVRLPVLCDPETAFAPDHPPDALHELALVELHVRVEEAPDVIDTGLAASCTVGTAGVPATVTMADWLADPAVPAQVNVNIELVVRPPVLCVPEVAFVPDQAPEAVQVVAFVELHVSVEDDPEVIELGLAVIWTVAVGDGLPPKLGL